ncbi:hypothetical protein ASPWEDRAFT_516548 [Aspergillus wentii DTO 134E9]|uniref:F-box domain-containing protein n=1 Tax=Aspergillus wentii DTO 134E9 TaxID=1073089 RepID=A0A1L9RL00_ASPWE|nr:uncharacterized protein ASPWEDRAFT_516548 [Aspergillus wentii DTO 134E9]KAI9924629.1 hypothetical protein MW887_006903 [Aspergillus wentii]OJJ35610.1 hypothetical protein ASPWEDRAFT_516548 [Aspergillus wentii DTO 134E9]
MDLDSNGNALPSFHPIEGGSSPPYQTSSDPLHHQPHQIDTAPRTSESFLVQLPPELLQAILSYFSAFDLARVSATCRILAEHGSNDLLWASLVNAHLPFRIHDPGPFNSFRSLYAAHHPYWFIPRNKIWFSDTEHTGNLILARYDNRRGVIEAYRVVAERQSHEFQIWDQNPDVIINTFHPKASLWLDDPVLLLKNHNSSGAPDRLRYVYGETRMPMAALESQHVFNSFSFCSNETPSDLALTAEQQWPPLTIPSRHRVYRDVDGGRSELDRPPRSLAQMSESAFRIRRWAQMGMPIFMADGTEALSTYATLDPELYTPTKEKPYQGIWVGDYSAHGCEFMLFMQRDPEPGSIQSHEAGESENDDEEVVPRGSLEAIKLTGDPNVPRGQISFVAQDIGPGGLVRVADEALFQGARMVRSQGHVAGLGFRDDTFIDSQLILISTDCVAHYWEAMGHISYLRRVDIDALLQS